MVRTFAEGEKVHYVQWPTGRRIFNGTIISGPHLTRDEPGDEPYEIYTVHPDGWGTWTQWTAECLERGWVELDPWP
jgi:hypothetical protein